ncbi:hypothetical protein [Micromonospora sp. NPDC047074]|uniref:hypothetical protein n=1 Tax=Micromonospora sp. NPDC047074 TaxID=3154339 RepID=UPI0033F6B1AB
MRIVPKALVAAAGVTGVVAYALPRPWSLVAAVADLLLVGLAGGLWARAVRRRDVPPPGWGVASGPPGAYGSPPFGLPGGSGAIPQQGTPPTATPLFPPPESSGPDGPLSRSRRRPRWLSSAVGEPTPPTRRVRRQPSATASPPPGPSPNLFAGPTDVHQGLANLEDLLRTTNQRGQRSQLWFFLAGVAVSIPAGVVVNLLTG